MEKELNKIKRVAKIEFRYQSIFWEDLRKNILKRLKRFLVLLTKL